MAPLIVEKMLRNFQQTLSRVKRFVSGSHRKRPNPELNPEICTILTCTDYHELNSLCMTEAGPPVSAHPEEQ